MERERRNPARLLRSEGQVAATLQDHARHGNWNGGQMDAKNAGLPGLHLPTENVVRILYDLVDVERLVNFEYFTVVTSGRQRQTRRSCPDVSLRNSLSVLNLEREDRVHD